MQIALDENGDRVSIFSAEEGRKYYCPFCGGILLQKRGGGRGYHFAHKSKSDCDYRILNKSGWHFDHNDDWEKDIEYKDSDFIWIPEKYVPKDPDQEERHLVETICVCNNRPATVELYTTKTDPRKLTGFNGCSCYPAGHGYCMDCANRSFLDLVLREERIRKNNENSIIRIKRRKE